GITPYAGAPPKGFRVDYLGILTDSRFRLDFGGDPERDGGAHVETRLPRMEDGEGWFESVNWIEAARAARGEYVMVTLGACYAAQAVGAQRALQLLNPMPYRLVSVEPDPENNAWIEKHYRDNGIDPAQQWRIQCAIGDSNAPILFPIGSPGTGAQNSFATNHRAAREHYFKEFVRMHRTKQALRGLLMENTTGIVRDLVPGRGFNAEIKMVSCVTLADVLGPFARVDYLEADIQQSEIIVFPPAMDVMNAKVRRAHIGTHGGDVHAAMVALFQANGWEIVFDFAPNGAYETALGAFTTNDGVLTALNPRL
ncbi:MAG: FkbM family methyltransferase, partial [Hyphomonadaceae bacterium]